MFRSLRNVIAACGFLWLTLDPAFATQQKHPVLDLPEHGLRVEFIRDENSPNSYQAVLRIKGSFGVGPKIDPDKLVTISHWTSSTLAHRFSLIDVPQTTVFIAESDQLPDDIGSLPDMERAPIIPFIVRFDGEVENKLLLVDPSADMPLYIPAFEAELNEVFFKSLRSGHRLDRMLTKFTSLNEQVGIMRPKPQEVHHAYFADHETAAAKREERRAKLRPRFDLWKDRLSGRSISAARMEPLLKLLEEVYPLDFNYLTKSDMAAFSARYALDFELINSMSVTNFLHFAKAGEQRVERLISELDVKEHRAIDSLKIKSLLKAADTKSELFKAALRFWGVKKAQGSVNDEEFYAGIRHLLGSGDSAVRMELARLLFHHPLPIQSARIRKFYINFIEQVPATSPRGDRSRRMSEELVRSLVETTRNEPSRQIDAFLRKLLQADDPRLSQVLADYRSNYEESLQSLEVAKSPGGGEGMPADEVEANKKCMSLFLSLKKRLRYLEILNGK